MIRVTALPALSDNYIYLLESGDGRLAVVDPGEAAPVERALCGRKLDLILCTHHHSDHVAGIQSLFGQHGCPIVCARGDLRHVHPAAQEVGDGDRIDVLGETFEVFATPGHTLNHVAYYGPNSSLLFTGDTLFSAGCGRLFEGTPEFMFASLRKLSQLPHNTQIFFGHEYTVTNLDFVLSRRDSSAAKDYLKKIKQRLAEGKFSTPAILGDELQMNPFLNADSVEEFAQWRTARDNWTTAKP